MMNKEYLYHYTNIEALFCILKNRTIRFNSLLFVDDPQEMLTSDMHCIGKYCYVSCWTDKEEYIPYWNMYTKDMHGVMIKIPVNPFEENEVFLDYFDGGRKAKTFVPIEIVKRGNLYYYPTMDFLRKIVYTNDESKLFIETMNYIKEKPNGKIDIAGNLNEIGLYKSESWAFQSEFRYSFFLFPHSDDGTLKIDITKSDVGLPFDYYDVSVPERFIDNIEVVCGPKMNETEYYMVLDILSKYAPSAKLSRSKLKIHNNK